MLLCMVCIPCALTVTLTEYSGRSVILLPLFRLVIFVAVGKIEPFWHIPKLQSVVKKLSRFNKERELNCMLIT